ncbi:MAG: hypothetical protein HOP11_09540 [Saprospiraceae bacterium]|nr:hypothetical protein [Saprospiraceae bacterium]
MKKNILSNLLIVLALTIFSGNLFSQAQTTGSWPPDYEVVQKCLDSSDLGTNFISYYEIQIHRAGFAVTTSTWRANGLTFTPPAGKVTLGNCPSSVSIVKDSIRDIEVLSLCNDASGNVTPFYRIIMRTYWPADGLGNTRVLGNIDITGAAYTPGATVFEGPCYGYNFTTEQTEEITINKTFSSFTYYDSWSVTNVGMNTITMATANGGQINLYPGETRRCSMQTDNHKKDEFPCQIFIVNASGGMAHVIFRGKL